MTPARLRTALVVLALLSLVACGTKGPDEDVVRQDFDRLLGDARGGGLYSIVSVSSGEGDSAGVPRHVKFSVQATQTRVMPGGLLAGVSFKAGEALSCGEAVLLYQRRDKGWVVASHKLARKPQPGDQPGC